MARKLLFVLAALTYAITATGSGRSIIVADSISGQPLPSASVFDNKGNALGMTDKNGRLPYIAPDNYPVIIRYLGYAEISVPTADADTIFLSELSTELPEILIESSQHKLLHILGYVREYSTMSTYSDTVFFFREKMVDYMLPADNKTHFRGWHNPRILKSKSYYRFINADGLDSVSNRFNNHFSWSDWIGIAPTPRIPASLHDNTFGSDTLYGKYSPAEVWLRNDDRLTVNVNVLADTTSRKWVPDLSGFFRKNLDFENFRLRYTYGNVVGDTLALTDLTGYSFTIESNGRGRSMFKFNKVDEPFYVTTYAEVYILDKEYITVKEAKKWAARKFETEDFDIIEPADASELQPAIKELIARVNAIDHLDIRTALHPDQKLKGRGVRRQQNMAQRTLSLLKNLTGITSYKFHRNNKRNWREFKKEQISRNNKQTQE